MTASARTPAGDQREPTTAPPKARLKRNKCGCGGTAGVAGMCPECGKNQRFAVRRKRRDFDVSGGLELGAAGNSLERQADQIADRVMRMPAEAPPAGFAAPQGTPATEGPLPVGLADQIDRAIAGGEPLAAAARDFFEPRFGHDFGAVRVHHDATAAALAGRLDAFAFTVGSDVFFNAGCYQPRTQPGRTLLAHELAHVVQQRHGRVSRQVQRASIAYRPVTWADFKGSVPAGSPFGAETSSGIDIPNWKSKTDVTDNKVECQDGKRKSTEHTATVSIDPGLFDTVSATMETDKSWTRPKYKTPDKFCSGLVKTCETEIGKQAAAATASCKQEVKSCQEAFDQGSTKYRLPVDGSVVEVSAKAECSTKLVSDCEKIMAKQHKFEFKDGADVVVTATSKADCADKTFLENCTKYYRLWSPRILKHEQGHFDISHVMAGKARADLKVQAATFTATATACGRVNANNQAVVKFRALNPGDGLKDRGQAWIDLGKQAEIDYDNDTDHGLKQKEQATWETSIAAGLKTYDLNKPAVAPQTPSQAPANPGGTGQPRSAGDGATMEHIP